MPWRSRTTHARVEATRDQLAEERAQHDATRAAARALTRELETARAELERVRAYAAELELKLARGHCLVCDAEREPQERRGDNCWCSRGGNAASCECRT